MVSANGEFLQLCSFTSQCSKIIVIFFVGIRQKSKADVFMRVRVRPFGRGTFRYAYYVEMKLQNGDIMRKIGIDFKFCCLLILNRQNSSGF